MNNTLEVGKIIINRPSSSGKTTLAVAAQKQFENGGFGDF
jgi:chloramphenicol 3-O-phosphotransferase